MQTAVLRHAEPLLSIRAPLIAGVATAAILTLGIAGVAIFGEANTNPPRSRSGFEPVPAIMVDSGETARAPAGAISFVEPDAEAEPSLNGVSDGFETPPAPARETGQGSDPASAEAAQAAAARNVAANPNALPPAPIARLTEPGPGGPLPVIGADGLRPSRAYARPFHGDPNAPTIGIVVGGMGLNRTVTEAAIEELPPEVALSFAAYTRDLQGWIDRARAAGHEVLIEAPMEPFDYPNNDPGPHTLLADGSAEENGRRLTWVLSRATGYFGVTNYLGARFSASPGAMEQVFSDLESRGVSFLHDGGGRRSAIEGAAANTNIEYAIADRILDEDLSPAAIDDRLLALEALAIQNGSALGTGFAYPATVDQVREWAEGLDMRGYQLAPPSAIMARRRLEARLESEAAGSSGGHASEGEAEHRWADNGDAAETSGASASSGH
mgnify:CR=1 FL=1